MRTSLSRRTVLRHSAAVAAVELTAACGGEPGSPIPTLSSRRSSTSTTGNSAAIPSAAVGTPARAASPAARGAVASPAVETDTSFTIQPAAHEGGRLVEGNITDAKTLCPTLESDTTSGRIISLIFDTLLAVDPRDTRPTALLAQKWDISSDGLTYTFTLREGVTFHDGHPLTAGDVKFSYDLLMTVSPRTGGLTDQVKAITVENPTTVVFTLKHPTASFLVSQCAGGAYSIVPQHILQGQDPAHLAQSDFATGKKGVTIGCGPFMFQEWVKGDHITLVKYPNYWQGEPHLDQYIYKVVPTGPAILNQLKTGELDMSTIQPSALQTMQQQPNVTITAYDTFGFTFYTYQLDPAKTDLFQDKAVRHALLYALDRKAMIDAIALGQSEVAVGTEPKLSWAYAPDQILHPYPYDRTKAKQLLAQAGWQAGPDGILAKNGRKLQFTLWTNAGSSRFEQLATVMQQQWKKLGIAMTLKTEEWSAFLDRVQQTHDFEMALVSFSWSVDPDQSGMWASGSYPGGFNMNKYSNPQVDQVLAKALQETDQNKRKLLYILMQNLVLDDLPTAILEFPRGLAVVNNRVHNVFPNAVSWTFNAHQWWVDP